MCHPGNQGIDFDSFNQSRDREYERDYLLENLDTLI